MAGSALILDSEHPNNVSRGEKLDYISTRLNKHELHAFMHLANEVNLCNLSKDNLEELFNMFHHILESGYKTKWKIKWTSCPIKMEREHYPN